MSLTNHLTTALGDAPAFDLARTRLAAGDDATLAVPGLVRPLLAAALFRTAPRPTLVVVAGEQAAERFARQLAALLEPGTVMHFAERREPPWSQTAADVDLVGARARALHALSSGRNVVVVASARSLLRALPPQGSHVFDPLVLAAGMETDLTQATERLARLGYERVESAEERGQFAVRGGVLDVFPSDSQHPLRAEFFGDEIETFRRYVPSTGQSIGDAGRAEIFACREVSLSARAADRAQRALRDLAPKDPFVAHHLDLIGQGIYFNGIERYMPYLYETQGMLTDYLANETLIVVAEPRSLFDDGVRRHEELEQAAKVAGVDLEGLVLVPSRLDLGGRQRLTLLSILRAGGAVDGELVARRPEVAGGEDKFLAGIRALASTGYAVVLAVPERRTRLRIAEELASAGLAIAEIGARSLREPGETPDGDADAVTAESADATSAPGHALERGIIHLAPVEVPAGFVIPDARIAVVSVDDIYPRSARARRTPREVDPTRMTFGFKPGDYVVHATHGIALFREMVRKEVLGAERDYLTLEYAKGDRLYVPVDQIDRISKYVGPDGSSPRVTRLNTADWSRATGKARTAARKLAFDLVDLYARRSTVDGHAFGPDTRWQLEMEAAFPYVETSDQLAAISDVKADMESDKPMDRLICGDVGYGKTEVALRAAFKAVQDGYQVMVLCPTTILAQQHFTTFSERFEPFGTRVEVLSRFRSKAEQDRSLAGFSAGEVDLLVGTHRLLSRDVAPKRLGLVIIDEEQRFGVGHKEHLKNLREQVDILTLSATPIPRTLQMSLSGVRDMSVIDTPPEGRFPVKVHVGEYDPDVVSGAIRRELERGGQVYFVSNRVRTIEDAEERVREAAPEARVGVAHGQMSENQLERVMETFSAGKFDVLVATTIIESGLDNPHSNTLIIEDSQRLGLAQLYQLKGRVGRSHVRAFAYFMFPRGNALTEQAAERLTAIRDHEELGSGIKVAMRDLEIRGAGSLLGAEQHGNMSAVGFDLFAEMLREAVAETRGEPIVAYPEVKVDLPISAFLPEEYVADVDERVRYYRRLAGSPTPEAVEVVATELRERFGALPEPARNLADIARIKALAAELGATNVSVVRRRVQVWPLGLEGARRGEFASRGGIYSEKDRKAMLPLDYGESVTAAVLGMLDAILTGAQSQ